MALLDEILAKLDVLPPEALVALEQQRRATAPIWLPNPGWQTVAINNEADEMFFGGEPGGGKALALDTPIPTPSGWTTMGRLRVGSEVFDENGRPTRVVATTPVMIGRPCYRVTFDDGHSVVADAEHLWVTMTADERGSALKLTDEWRAQRRARRPSRAGHGKRRRPDLALANTARTYTYKAPPPPRPRTTAEIAATLFDGKHRNHSVAVCPELTLRGVALPIPPYTLGAWLGDGTSIAPAITSMDPEILAEIGKDGFVLELDRSSVIGRGKARTYRIRRMGQQIQFGGYGGPTSPMSFQIDLKTNRLFGNKHIPGVYLRASRDDRLLLLAGLMDTDGSADQRGKCEFTSTNKALADGVAELLLTLGVKAVVTEGRAMLKGVDCGPKYRVIFTPDMQVFKLPRKAERLRLDRNVRKTQKRRFITSVDSVPSVPVKCIQVAAESHQYLCGRGFIPTHNSFLIVGAAITRHRNAIIFRREFPQIKGLEDAAEAILGSRDGYNASNHVWRIPGPEKRVLEFGSVPFEKDKKRYQGRAHDLKCVAPETLVLLADGSFKPIREISLGELVQTLDGPRRVTAIHHVTRPAVRLAAVGQAQVSQVQSATHELLTRSGWRDSGWSTTSRDDPDKCRECDSGADRSPSRSLATQWSGPAPRQESGGSLSSKHSNGNVVSSGCLSCSYYRAIELPRAQRSFGGLLSMARAIRSRLCIQPSDLWPTPALGIQGSGRLGSPGSFAYAARPIPDIGSGSFVDQLREVWRLALAYALPAHAEQGLLANGLSASRQHAAHGACDVRTCSGFLGSQERYWSSPRQGDEHAPLVLEDVLMLAQPLGDAGQRTPIYWPEGGRGASHTRNRCTWSYVHPYTKEIRRTDRAARVSSFQIDYVGSRGLIDLTVDDANHYITEHGFINRNCFDEITQFTKSQYKYLTLWLRSPDAAQRTRIIATGNPPDSPEGLWVIEYWGPWLDPNHPDPAEPGELRWPVPAEEGSDREIFFHSREEAMAHVGRFKNPPVDHTGKLLPPRSRTFVPGKLEENPEYVKSGYQSVLAYTSQDLKDLASGDFHSGLKDHPDQVIPSAWIVSAQQRWTPRPPSGAPMSAIGVDVAQGGPDETVLAPRHDAWYAPLVVVPGKDTPMPSDVAALVVKHRRDQAAVIVDCGGGYGGGVVERLSENSIATVAHKGSTKSGARSKCRQYTFINKRAEVWWRFREALDPEQFGGSPIELPDEAAIRADLAAPHFFVTPRGIQIEEKEETKKRIGRSPDKGDAIVMAWAEGQDALRRGISGPGAMPRGVGHVHQSRPAFANVSYRNAKRRH